jgi:hypothetical protein
VGRGHYQSPALVRRDTPSRLYRVLQPSGALPRTLAQRRAFPSRPRAGGTGPGLHANVGTNDRSGDLAADRGGLCVKPRGQMTARHGANVDALKAASAEFTAMRRLAMRLRGLLRSGTAEGLEAWLIDARASGIYGMQRFARALRQNLEAVRNAVSSDMRQESCMDVYGPRPIATAGWITVDGHNCRRISGFVMRLDNVVAASLDGFSPASTSKPPRHRPKPCRSTHQVREATG